MLTGAFRVITRNRAAEVYGLRKALPAFYKCGAVTAVNETLDPLHEYTNLEALTRSIGQVLQRFKGQHFTLLTQDWSEGQAVLHVESTLDFESTGGVRVGEMTFTYAGKTDSTFIGVAPADGLTLASIPTDTKVVPYDKRVDQVRNEIMLHALKVRRSIGCQSCMALNARSSLRMNTGLTRSETPYSQRAAH